MTIYTCPMHPEIEQEIPGTCPKCGGMKLVDRDVSIGSAMAIDKSSDVFEDSINWKSYMPLLVILGLILITSFTLALRDAQYGVFSLSKTISSFMAGFFIVFSGFKLMDLKGFAEGYSTYDLLAKRLYSYGYVYPFIELFFGLSMILIPDVEWLLLTELIVMTFSGIGVAIKLAKNEKFKCACLGTFLKVPLTKVSLIEDFGMAVLASLMLLIS